MEINKKITLICLGETVEDKESYSSSSTCSPEVLKFLIEATLGGRNQSIND